MPNKVIVEKRKNYEKELNNIGFPFHTIIHENGDNE